MGNERIFEALANVFIPGLGQMLQGRTGRGIGFLIGVPLGLLLFVIPGIVLYLYAIVDAYKFEVEK